ncbi:AMP-binding protein [Halopseudomonas pachastrellae]|nr:AMP-binding protein [Halopseudomonas pachastrellae]
MTYAELDDLSNRCAALLQAQGIKPGDRVAVFMPNCPQLHIAFLRHPQDGRDPCPGQPDGQRHGAELSAQRLRRPRHYLL